MSEPYRPSNGTEGEMFEARFCDRCANDTDLSPCPIVTAAWCFSIGDGGYPAEWITDDYDTAPPKSARCTAFTPEVTP